MQTLSPEQFKTKYGQSGVDAFAQSNQQPSYVKNVTDIVGSDLADRAKKFQDIQNSDASGLEKGVQMFGQGSGLAANTLETVVGQIPGVKQVAEGIGSGLHWLVTSPLSVVKGLGDILGQSKTLQEVTHLYDTDQNFKNTVDAVGNIVRLGGDVQTAVDSANFTKNVTNKVINEVKNTTNALLPKEGLGTSDTLNTIKDKFAPKSSEIMNRVARLNPTDENAFVKMSGKTPGEYLTETGNFGSPDKIITSEATKFANSVNEVDTALEKLPGVYKDGSIEDALNQLAEKSDTISTSNTPAPFKFQVEEWISKYKSGGLSMQDINGVKRLFEKEVKLGYNKLLNADKVAQATNIDSALRKWQLQQAYDLGFTNIADLNKQTQISKFIVNKLGAKILGQSGNNSISLTDWIVLAGGNPNAVAAFLTKKFLSSSAVQARIAELLNKGEIKAPIKANVQPTIENTLRTQFPQGTKLELPTGKVNTPQVQNNVPIERNPAYTSEPQAQAGTKTTINPKTGDAYIRDIKTGKVIKIIPKKK